MEQAPYWMWTKRKPSLISTRGDPVSTINSPVSYDSWEEQAFAEDATGALGGGGCIWPPRSYSCSFCRRDFRSAQALGGHMNVHRRDRARLKQFSPTNQNQLQHHRQDHRGVLLYHPSLRGLAYQHPNSRVSALPVVQESSTNKCDDDDDDDAVDDCYNQQITTVPHFPSNSTISQEHNQKSIVVGKCNEFILDLNRQGGEASQRDRYSVKSDRPVSLNLVLHQTCSSNVKEGAIIRRCNKRRRSSSF